MKTVISYRLLEIYSTAQQEETAEANISNDTLQTSVDKTKYSVNNHKQPDVITFTACCNEQQKQLHSEAGFLIPSCRV